MANGNPTDPVNVAAAAEVVVEVAKKTGQTPIVVDNTATLTTRMLNKIQVISLTALIAVVLTLIVVLWQVMQQIKLTDFERNVNRHLNCKLLDLHGVWDNTLCKGIDLSKEGERKILKKAEELHKQK